VVGVRWKRHTCIIIVVHGGWGGTGGRVSAARRSGERRLAYKHIKMVDGRCNRLEKHESRST